jgi:hypothetical protein
MATFRSILLGIGRAAAMIAPGPTLVYRGSGPLNF